MNTSVREMRMEDIELVVDYFLDANGAFLKSMGVDKKKLPSRIDWINRLIEDFKLPLASKKFYYLIWELDGEAIGHSNINNIEYGCRATMHLHIWELRMRQLGLGSVFLQQTIPIYFREFELNKLICEPYAENPGPNKAIPKTGFELIRTYDCIPGWINFHQTVNRYELSKDKFANLFLSKK